MGLLNLFFGDRQAEREHQERLEQIRLDANVKIQKSKDSTTKFTNAADNLGKVGSAYFEKKK